MLCCFGLEEAICLYIVNTGILGQQKDAEAVFLGVVFGLQGISKSVLSGVNRLQEKVSFHDGASIPLILMVAYGVKHSMVVMVIANRGSFRAASGVCSCRRGLVQSARCIICVCLVYASVGRFVVSLQAEVSKPLAV